VAVAFTMTGPPVTKMVCLTMCPMLRSPPRTQRQRHAAKLAVSAATPSRIRFLRPVVSAAWVEADARCPAVPMSKRVWSRRLADRPAPTCPL
jgi:hypothetical protein